MKYASGPGGYYYRGIPTWAHGYVPAGLNGARAEFNLTRILNEVSHVNPHIEETGVFTLDDPELFKYPIAYLAEPGFWTLDDRESASLRAYLLKGGFRISGSSQPGFRPIDESNEAYKLGIDYIIYGMTH